MELELSIISFVICNEKYREKRTGFSACAFLCRNAAFDFLFFYELSYKYAIMKRCIFLIEVQYD